MKRLNIFMQLFIIIFLVGSQHAQEQTKLKIQLPQLSEDQKLDRAVMNSISYMMMGISYAKHLGRPTDEYAEYCAKITIPFYQRIKGENPLRLIERIYAVSQADKYFTINISDTTKSKVQARMSLYGIQYVERTDAFGGVSVDDCYNFYNKFMQSFCELLGYEYQYHMKEGLIDFSIIKKE